MNEPIPQPATEPATEPAADATPPKPISLVARMLKAGEDMLARRAAKRAEREKKAAELPWWKRTEPLLGRVLHESGASTRRQRRTQLMLKAKPEPAMKAVAEQPTKAQRKRRRQRAGAVKGPLFTAAAERPRSKARAAAREASKAARRAARASA